MKLFEILNVISLEILHDVEFILGSPCIKTEARKKKAILDHWNCRIKQAYEMTDNVYYKACIYSYYGMITSKTMQMLELWEVVGLISAIQKQMETIKEGDFNEGV